MVDGVECIVFRLQAGLKCTGVPMSRAQWRASARQALSHGESVWLLFPGGVGVASFPTNGDPHACELRREGQDG